MSTRHGCVSLAFGHHGVPRERRIWNAGIATLATLVCVLGATLASAAPASATTFDFCGTSSSPVRIPGGEPFPYDRCVDSVQHTYVYVQQRTGTGYTPTYSCGLAKQYSDGSGSNETPAACSSNSINESDCTSHYGCPGYATIINKDCCVLAGIFGYASIL